MSNDSHLDASLPSSSGARQARAVSNCVLDISKDSKNSTWLIFPADKSYGWNLYFDWSNSNSNNTWSAINIDILIIFTKRIPFHLVLFFIYFCLLI